jgi:uncharacterized membrane protein
MSRSDIRFAGAFAATIVCMAILVWGRSPLLNLAAAGPLLLYLPGWAVLRAFDAEPEGFLESVVLKSALSLALVVIAGLLLNLVGGITRVGWLVALGGIILAALVAPLAIGRRAEVATPSRVAGARWASFRFRDLSMIVMAIGLLAGAAAISVVSALRQHEFHYTQLWIVPKEKAPNEVVIGLHSEEQRPQSYAVEVLVDHHLVQTWNDVALDPGQTWTTTFRWVGLERYPHPILPMRELSNSQEAPVATISQRVGLGATPRVEAIVYKSDNRSVIYRDVWTAPQCVSDESAHGRPPCEF